MRRDSKPSGEGETGAAEISDPVGHDTPADERIVVTIAGDVPTDERARERETCARWETGGSRGAAASSTVGNSARVSRMRDSVLFYFSLRNREYARSFDPSGERKVY